MGKITLICTFVLDLLRRDDLTCMDQRCVLNSGFVLTNIELKYRRLLLAIVGDVK